MPQVTRGQIDHKNTLVAKRIATKGRRLRSSQKWLKKRRFVATLLAPLVLYDLESYDVNYFASQGLSNNARLNTFVAS